ncbi:MAG: Ig-like domain-containing protein [Desulfotignum sp.]|nr:Ig-like domain-containing protein [Desulfotignum sp.]MCF8136225.1 Ig-like domain-containing protein [Desulfotignum sp.]
MVWLQRLVFCWLIMAVPAWAAPVLESVYPNQGVMGQALEVTVKGEGFEDETRVSMILDIGNKKSSNGSVLTPGFKAQAVAVAGDYAFAVDWGGMLHVVDVSDPHNPVIIHSMQPAGGKFHSMDIKVAGNHLFMADNQLGLAVLDISNPAEPVEISTLKPSGANFTNGVTVSGNNVFLSDGLGLWLISFDPDAPENTAVTGSFLGEGGTFRAAVAGSVAYAVDYGTLLIIDVATPAAPKLLGKFVDYDLGLFQGVAVIDNTAFIAAGEKGVIAVDVTDPETPVLLDTLLTSGKAYNITAVDQTLYVADWRGGVQMIDATEPADLRLAGSVDTPGWAYDLAVEDNTAYVADEWKGLRLIDISSPTPPPAIGRMDTGPVDDVSGLADNDTSALDLVGNLAYVTDLNYGLRIIDISDPAQPQLVGSAAAASPLHEVAVIDDVAYVANEESGLQLLNVSDPADPQFFAAIDTPGSAMRFVIQDDTAFLADGNSGLQIIDIKDSQQMKIVGSADTPGFARGVAVAGNYVYVADDTSGLQVIDISDPANPQIKGTVDTPGDAWSVRIIGQVAYVADRLGGIQLVDISLPLDPKIIGEIKLESGAWAWDMTVAGNTAYVANCAYGILVLDVSDPAKPGLMGAVDTLGSARRVFPFGDKALVGDWNSGLVIVPLPVELSGVTVNSGNSLDLVLPSPQQPGNYTLWVYTGSEASELPGAINFSTLDLAAIDSNDLVIQTIDGQSAPASLAAEESVFLQLIYNSPFGTPFNLSNLSDVSVEWFTSNPQVLSISPLGRLSAHAPGGATISAQITSGRKSLEITVPGAPKTNDHGNLIILTGRRYPEETLEQYFAGMANAVYQTFYQRGFDHDDISYFSAYGSQTLPGTQTLISDREFGVSEGGLQAEIIEAITTWAPAQDNDGPLYLYLLDHGVSSQAVLSMSTGSPLYGSAVQKALTEFEEDTGRPVIVVVESCYAGHWLTALDGGKRVVIAGASAQQAVNLPTDNPLSFSHYFFEALGRGNSFQQAFDIATTQTQALAFAAGQSPQLAAGGNDLDQQYLVGSFASKGMTPLFTGHTGKDAPVLINQYESLTLEASLNMPYADGFEVWVDITPPGVFQQQLADSDATPYVTPQKVVLDYQGEADATAYFGGDKLFGGSAALFDQPGVYDLVYFAKNISGQLLHSEHVAVSVQADTGKVVAGAVQILPSAGGTLPVEFQPGQESSLIVSLVGTTTPLEVAWFSSNPGVVSVDNSGKLSAISPGQAKITAIYNGGTISYEISVAGEPGKKSFGNLLLVAGLGQGELGGAGLSKTFCNIALTAYRMFHNRGLSHDDIYYLSPYGTQKLPGSAFDLVDGVFGGSDASAADLLTGAITGWAAGQANSGPLYVQLVGHGYLDYFVVSAGSQLAITALKTALDAFQTATGRAVVVLAEACYSGNWLDTLQGENRLIITSNDANSYNVPTTHHQNTFTAYLAEELSKGVTLATAFESAEAKVEINQQTPQQSSANAPALWDNPLVGGFASASASFFTDYSGKDGTLVPNSEGTLTLNGSADIVDSTGMNAYAWLVPPQVGQEVQAGETPTCQAVKINFAIQPGTGEITFSGAIEGLNEPGQYLLTYCLEDSLGEVFSSEPVMFSLGSQSPVTLPLAAGWNLLGTRTSVTVADTFADTAAYASIWKWDAGSWAVYLPGEVEPGSYAAGKGFAGLTTIEPGEGFWVNSLQAGSVTLSGTPASGPLQLTPGWNLVALKDSQETTVAALLSGKTDAVASLWKWQDGGWAVFLPGENDLGAAYAASKGFALLEEITPGEGFWVNATEAVVLQ